MADAASREPPAARAELPAEPAVVAAVAEAHRREWARVLASVMRLGRDPSMAEDAVQDAFVAALRTWSRDGIPDNPGAWLTTAARRHVLNRLHREATLRDRLPLLAVEPAAAVTEDDRLPLIFMCCHPALALHARVALTLRLVCGLDTADIAALFLVSEATMTARLTRAKKKIRAAGIAYRTPSSAALPDRLPAVLAVVHLLHTTGHTARRGTELTSADAAGEAKYLAELLAALMPDESEVLGLLALVLLGDARRLARVDDAGDLVLLADQDRRRWDAAAIARGVELVAAALRRGSGPYALQAAIAAVHTEAPSYEETDWAQIVALYDRLLLVHPSPVVALARAVAVGMASGPAAGLAEIDRVAPALAGFHRLPAARADLLRRLGRTAEAMAAYQEAAALATNEVERAYLASAAARLP